VHAFRSTSASRRALRTDVTADAEGVIECPFPTLASWSHRVTVRVPGSHAAIAERSTRLDKTFLPQELTKCSQDRTLCSMSVHAMLASDLLELLLPGSKPALSQ
jgi:hypothetical protein